MTTKKLIENSKLSKKRKKLSALDRKILFNAGKISAPFIVIFFLLNFILKWHLNFWLLSGGILLIISLTIVIMQITIKQSGFLKTVQMLQIEGYSDRYVDAMKVEISKAEKLMQFKNAEGFKAMLGFALFFRGELNQSYDLLKKVRFNILRKGIKSMYANNLIAVAFFLGKEDEAIALYNQFEKIIISDQNALMRRTLGIREYIRNRYENAVTIFIKLMEIESKSDTLFSDICLVKAMLKLDMFESSLPFLKFFERYRGMYQLDTLASDLKREALAGMQKEKSKGHLKKINR